MKILSVKALGKGRYRLLLENGEQCAIYRTDAQKLGFGRLGGKSRKKSRSRGDDYDEYPSEEDDFEEGLSEEESIGEGISGEEQNSPELTPEGYRLLKEEILPERARARAMYLLAKRDYPSEQIREKLQSGCYPEDCIDVVIKELQELGYLDDAQYTRDYIEANLKGKGKRRLKADLLRKGIPSEIFEGVYLEIAGTDCPPGETDSCSETAAESTGSTEVFAEDHISPEERAQRSERLRIHELLIKKGYHGEQADDKEKRRVFGFLARRGFSPPDILAAMREYSDTP